MPPPSGQADTAPDHAQNFANIAGPLRFGTNVLTVVALLGAVHELLRVGSVDATRQFIPASPFEGVNTNAPGAEADADGDGRLTAAELEAAGGTASDRSGRTLLMLQQALLGPDGEVLSRRFNMASVIAYAVATIAYFAAFPANNTLASLSGKDASAENFADALDDVPAWRAFQGIHFVGCFVGWVLAAYIQRRSVTRGRELAVQLMALRRHEGKLRKRCVAQPEHVKYHVPCRDPLQVGVHLRRDAGRNDGRAAGVSEAAAAVVGGLHPRLYGRTEASGGAQGEHGCCQQRGGQRRVQRVIGGGYTGSCQVRPPQGGLAEHTHTSSMGDVVCELMAWKRTALSHRWVCCSLAATQLHSHDAVDGFLGANTLRENWWSNLNLRECVKLAELALLCRLAASRGTTLSGEPGLFPPREPEASGQQGSLGLRV